MPTEEDDHGAQGKRTDKEYALPKEHGIPLSKPKRQDGQGSDRGVQEEGETHPAHEKDVVSGQDIQDTKSFLHLFKPIGIKIQGISDRQRYEIEPSKRIPTSMEQFLKEIQNVNNSPSTREETLRIFQKIVTDPKSVCSVFRVINVTYVFILVESSPDDEGFAASVDGHNTVLAVIYDATNKRFVLVLYGEIQDSTEWRQEIRTTVYNIILCIYGRVYNSAITHCKNDLVSRKLETICNILKALNANATEAMRRDVEIRKRLAMEMNQMKQYECPPGQSERLSITDGNSQLEQQQQPLRDQWQQPQQPQQLQPQQTSQPNEAPIDSHVQLERRVHLMEDEVTREQSLNQSKKKSGEPETTRDEQTVRDVHGSINCN
ncbi:uncharacterized protein [Haliotis asinina]|uniref:uncharacterized protein isoform X2 n=1 Tax=Haliotis asinina TaxID=109174 RepID=UPI003531B4E5